MTWLFYAIAFAGAPWPDAEPFEAVDYFTEDDAAVVVGVTDYFVLPRVAGGESTARVWQRWLISRGMGASKVRLLAGRDATKELMLSSVEAMVTEAPEGASVWFVFVGHGATTELGTDGLLVGVDAQRSPASLKTRSLARSDLLDVLENPSHSRDQQRTVILDACFSGMTSSDPRSSLLPGLQPVVPLAWAEAEGSTVLSAARHDQYAGPLPGHDRPAFSYLLTGALSGWGDIDGNGRVSAEEARTYVAESLSLTLVDRSQEPMLEGPGWPTGFPTVALDPDMSAVAFERQQEAREAQSATLSATMLPDISSLEHLIAERECQVQADMEAQERARALLAQRAADADALLVSEWRRLNQAVSRCIESGENELLVECGARLREFVDAASVASVVSEPAEADVQTDCGPVRGLSTADEIRYGEEAVSDALELLQLLNGQLGGSVRAEPHTRPSVPYNDDAAYRERMSSYIGFLRDEYSSSMRRRARYSPTGRVPLGRRIGGGALAVGGVGMVLAGGALSSQTSTREELGTIVIGGGVGVGLAGLAVMTVRPSIADRAARRYRLDVEIRDLEEEIQRYESALAASADPGPPDGFTRR